MGGGWALEIESFLGLVKWHRADRRVPFGGQKTTCDLHVAKKNDLCFGLLETNSAVCMCGEVRYGTNLHCQNFIPYGNDLM